MHFKWIQAINASAKFVLHHRERFRCEWTMVNLFAHTCVVKMTVLSGIEMWNHQLTYLLSISLGDLFFLGLRVNDNAGLVFTNNKLVFTSSVLKIINSSLEQNNAPQSVFTVLEHFATWTRHDVLSQCLVQGEPWFFFGSVQRINMIAMHQIIIQRNLLVDYNEESCKICAFSNVFFFNNISKISGNKWATTI